MVQKDHNFGKNTGNIQRLFAFNIPRVTIGIYQIKQAAFYIREHVAKDGDYVLHVHKQGAALRVKLQSLSILYPSNTNFGFDMRRMALILSKIRVVNAKREHL